MSSALDAVVVGGGVVGLACAARLAREGRSVALIERHARHGLETSSRNSEVVHAGFYYPSGSLKARLCVAGRPALYDLCRRHGVFARKTGKLVVAASASERPRLEELARRGRENGVDGLELIDAAQASRLAPGVRCEGALWSARTGIVDAEGLMSCLLGLARDRGALLAFGSGLEAASPESGGYRLRVGGDSVLARCVVNSAGLEADRVAALPGLDAEGAGYRLYWHKGEYFSLRRRLPIERLVYPLPQGTHLGVHLTIDAQGRQRLGPNAFAYPRPARGAPPKDLYSVDPAHRRDFWREAARYLPDLREDDLEPGTAGLRPKLSADGGFRDFVIAEESGRGLAGWVNLVGIESPGLSASLAIADSVADLLGWDS